jgi:hypothetical protein
MLAGAAFLMSSHVLSHRGAQPASTHTAVSSVPFAVATVHFERNLKDNDFEAVFEAKGGTDGLARLVVLAPDGRTVVDLDAPDGSTLGVRQIRFESPEPHDLALLKRAYPEGTYSFTGTTAGGDTLRSSAALTHQFPAPASLLRPAAEAKDVSRDALEITWTAVPNLAAYIVKLEQEDLGHHVTSQVPTSMNRFAVPRGFLRAGTEYTISIGTISQKGNVSFVESAFTTAGAIAGQE